MRWVRERVAEAVGRVGVAVVVLAGLAILVLAVGTLLGWANKHAFIPAAYASAAVAAASVATATGKSLLKSTLSKGQHRNAVGKQLLVSPGQHDKPLKVAAVDPAHLRIHASATGSQAGLVPYVRRDLHDELARLIAAGSFVLLQGGSAAGKTRLAYEAARTAVPHWTMVVPDPPVTTPKALAGLADLAPRHTLIWLDDLQRYLTPDGLTEKVLDQLVSAKRGVSIVATLNTSAKAALGAGADGTTDRSLRAEALRVVERAEQQGIYFVSEQLSITEADRAATLGERDSRLGDALSHNSDDGFVCCASTFTAS